MKETKIDYSSHNPKILVKDTKRYGKGVFAGEDIEKGDTIIVFTGERISLEEIVNRVTSGSISIDDGFQIDENEYLALDPIPNLFNHSCNPNSIFRNDTELFAIRDIKKGEEIVYDYSTTVGPNITPDMWTMHCNCGSTNCRRIVSNVLTVPKASLEKYKKLRGLQNHIRKKLPD